MPYIQQVLQQVNFIEPNNDRNFLTWNWVIITNAKRLYYRTFVAVLCVSNGPLGLASKESDLCDLRHSWRKLILRRDEMTAS